MRDDIRTESPRIDRPTIAWLVILAVVLLLPGRVHADFVQRTFRDDSGEHPYTVFLPKGYSPDKKWPVVLFLHGAGERGTDGKKHLTVGLGPVLEKRKDTFPFVVVFPQCEASDARYLNGWLADSPDTKRALAMLGEVEGEYSIDTSRRILTGWSMGGYGTWSVAAADPTRWSAILPLAGGGTAEMAAHLTEVPIWAFHGSEDAAIRPAQSRRMIAALRAAGAEPRYTEVTGGGHDINHVVYDTDAVINWMLDPTGAQPGALALSVPLDAEPVDTSPFIAALELEGAATVRLGNTMLDALAMSIPSLLPKNLLQGALDDIYDSTVVEGLPFNITFGRVSYSADLWRVRFKAYRKDRLNVQVGVQNAVLRIGGTSVVGRDHSASAGPMDIVIGHREPVWLSFDVTPYIKDRRLKLRLVATRFDIPHDNWYVTYPAGVSVRGFGMTRDKVSNGLVEGLYGNKARIEQEVTSLVPSLVTAMEEKLQLDQANGLVRSFWPLPVYSPRVRIWPQDVSTDDNGVSVVLGITAAAVDASSAPEKPVRRAVTKIAASDIPRSKDLHVGVAPNMLQGLTELLVAADVAKINVLDIPEATFAGFADRATLTRAFPELDQLDTSTEISSELHLAGPIEITSAKDSERMAFQAPDLMLKISTRPGNGQAPWEPFAEIRYSVGQGADTSLQRVTDDTRALQLEWKGDTDISTAAEFASSYTPTDTTIKEDVLTDLFRQSWKRWTGQGPASQTIIPDFDLGLTQLRLSEAGWKSPYLAVTFSAPGVKLTNSSDENMVYETKGPFSDWGGPYTLEPGKSHDFPIAYPLIYRRKVDEEFVVYSLAPGSHSEFRTPRTGGPPRLFKAREGLDIGNVDATARKTGETTGNETSSSVASGETPNASETSPSP